MSRTLVQTVVVAALLSTSPALLSAQASSQRPLFSGSLASQQPAAAEPRRFAFAINPLGIPFEIVSVELEGAMHDAFTLSGNFSYFSPDEFTRSSIEVKGRLYPNEQALRGFSVGFGLGAVNTREYVFEAEARVKQDKTYPSIGVYVDYNWLLGKSSRFYVGSGLGAKRILGERDDFDDAPFVYGTARFLIGVAW